MQELSKIVCWGVGECRGSLTGAERSYHTIYQSQQASRVNARTTSTGLNPDNKLSVTFYLFFSFIKLFRRGLVFRGLWTQSRAWRISEMARTWNKPFASLRMKLFRGVGDQRKTDKRGQNTENPAFCFPTETLLRSVAISELSVPKRVLVKTFHKKMTSICKKRDP